MLRTGELDLVGVTPDTLLEGRTHERLAQRYKGLPVIGGAIARQREGDVVRTIFGKVYLDIAMEVTPQLDEATAAARAIEAHGGEAVAVAGEAALAVLPTAGGDYALVWRMTVRTPTDIRTVAVNALSGGIESDRSRLRDQLPNIGIGTGVGGDRKKVPATRNSQGYQATDQTRPALLSAYDFRGSLSRLNEFLLNGFVLDSDRAIDTDNVWTDGAVVDGHVYVGWTYDFYFKRFGRHGMDDLDGSITTILHPIFRADAGTVDDQTFNLFVDNAEYLGNRQLMLGDGDGTLFDYFAGALDVVAHEYSHGVTEYSSNLDYVDEPGALNAWAPDLFYDEVTADYVIVWATAIPGRFPATDTLAQSTTRGRADHRLYFVTTRDFKTYSRAKLLYDGGFSAIDGTITKRGDVYYLVMKDETLVPPARNLRVAVSRHATGPYSAASGAFTDHDTEGPSVLTIGEWHYVYYDAYTRGRYAALRTRDFEHWEPLADSLRTPRGIRHGSAFLAPESVLRRLQSRDSLSP